MMQVNQVFLMMQFELREPNQVTQLAISQLSKTVRDGVYTGGPDQSSVSSSEGALGGLQQSSGRLLT